MIKIDVDTLTLAHETDFRKGPDSIKGLATRQIWDRGTITNGSFDFAVDPKWGKWSPFSFHDHGLSITAMETPEELKGVGMPYVSGILTSHPHTPGAKRGFSQLGGYWEASLRLPSGQGAWPSFWALPTHETWPKGVAVLPEIDVMECLNRKAEEGQYECHRHTNIDGVTTDAGSSVETGLDLSADFHRYGVLWTREFIAWIFDGVEIHREPTGEDMVDPMHWIVSLAVGGRWPGDPDPADYPLSLDAEYVRVYAPTEPYFGETDDTPPEPDKPTPPADPTPDANPTDPVYQITASELGRSVADLLGLRVVENATAEPYERTTVDALDGIDRTLGKFLRHVKRVDR